MSHEIRTPLHGVKGALQIIEGKPLTTELATLVKIALRSIKTMSLLVDDILDFSKVEAGKIQITPRTFSMDVLLDSLYQEFKNIAYDKHLEFEFKKHLNSDIWIGDDLRIKQIFANLISNAIKFTRVGCVTLEIKGADDGIVFTVTDSGIGMTESGLSVLFNRFEQADTSITRSFGGSGLGMSITKSLIELMGGSIHTESEINKGSCFTVSLPLVPVDQELAVNK